ncbi:putative flippase GtrA [Rhizobium mesoamericanum]|uniref:GtrA family protein n=1 Tax=Rhizobium mesoamericanum TaxID=1079800 RepID=UPI002780F0D0|nr:GtrA family protein [Rhizobium mesoamericanum]MDQ0561944.1 putative flippase GtrA [Rhizobium mesoamericanum]
MQTVWQALRFGLVGLANTAVGLLTIYAAIYFGDFSPLLANAAGYACGLVLSFILNQLWTFPGKRSIGTVLPRYVLVAAASYLINFALVYVGSYFLHIGPYEVQLLGVVAYTVSMFCGCKWFAFAGNNVIVGPVRAIQK